MKDNKQKSTAYPSAKMTVGEQAVEWMLKLDSDTCSNNDREAFAHWLQQSPQHLREFLAMESAWGGLDSISDLDKSTIDKLQQKPEDENVVPFNRLAPDNSIPALRPSTKPRPRWWQAIRVRPVAAAASIVSVLCLSLLLYASLEPDESLYTTAIGEQRSWTLEDGSVLHLNTHSRLKIRYTPQQRLILLLAGEALFDVAHDTERPFYVRTDDALVRAVGTSFNVYRSENHTAATVVTVVEGKVAVSPIALDLNASDNSTVEDNVIAVAPPPEEYKLSAGGQVTVKPTGEMVQQTAVNDVVEAATAWRGRKLVFDSKPLNAVVAEFNRYNRNKIVVTDEAIAARIITGVFDANRPGDLLTFLDDDHSVSITRLHEQVIIGRASL